MADKNLNDVMKTLKAVPEVQEHLNKFSVIMGKQILKRRIDLGFTQHDVVHLIQAQGEKITQEVYLKLKAAMKISSLRRMIKYLKH